MTRAGRQSENNPEEGNDEGQEVRPGGHAAIAVLALGGGVAACGSDDDDGGGGGSGGGDLGKSAKIALLLPETKTARYESQDRPNFERKVKELCSNCEVIYSNADRDPAKQLSQVEAAITKQVDVMVLDPVDSASAAGMVAKAKAQNIPVISHDRLITDAPDLDYYISFDNVKVGQLQGQALVDKLKEDGAKGDIFMINGSPTDNNAKLFKQGAHSVIDKSEYKVAKEYDTPDWSPDKAQQEADQAITALGKDGFVGVYAANDGTAGGAIAAMKARGSTRQKVPTTGQDAEPGRHPADPGGRAVHDGVQGDHPRGRGGRRAGGRAGSRRGSARERHQRQDGQQQEAGPIRADPGRGHEGQRPGHDRQGRLLEGQRDLRGRVQGRLRQEQDQVSDGGPRRGEEGR